MSKFVWPKLQLSFDAEEHAIMVGVAGSRSYGTNTPESDTDYKGILATPRDIVLSPFKGFVQVLWKSEEKSGRLSELAEVAEAESEGTFFSLSKFISLATKSNPNVIETLFVDESHILHLTEEGKLFRDNRELFLS